MIGYRVFKIIRFHNKTIIAMIFFLNCQLLSKLMLFATNASLYNHPCSATLNVALFTVLPMLPVACLSMAAIMNLNNWIVYYIKIGKMASHVDERAEKYGDPKRIWRLRLIINLVTIVSTLALITFCTWLCIHTIKNPKDSKLPLLEVVSGITFLILGGTFGVTGIMNNYRLYKYFRPFYHENKCMLFLAAIGLSVPLIVRGALDTARYYSPNFNRNVEDHRALYDTMLYLLLDLVPIGFQLSSLIFGYIRRQKNRKARLEINT